MTAVRDLRHYAVLDGLRGAAALYVVMYHFTVWVPSALPRWLHLLERPFSFGHLPVSFFIVLSGFSLMLPVAATPDGSLRGGARQYLFRRARRILPPYYAALFLAVVVNAVVGTPVPRAGWSLLTHVLLVHNLFLPFAFDWNMAHWSVGVEWQIYFLFPFVLLPFWRHGGGWLAVSIALVIGALPLVLLPPTANLSWCCPWYIGLFAMGMVAAVARERGCSESNRRLLRAMGFGLVGVYLGSWALLGDAWMGYAWINFAKDSVAGAAIAILLLEVTLQAKVEQTGRFGRWILESPPAVALGRMSYSLYLIHCSILAICLAFLRHTGWSASAGLAFRVLVGVPATIAGAWLFASWLERPALRRRMRAPGSAVRA